MPRECKVCAHPCRQEIDHKLAHGVTRTEVAREFGLTRAAVSRHAANHLLAVIAQARPIGTAEVVNAAYLLGRIRQLEKLTLWGVGQAQQEKQLGVMFQGIKEARECLRFYFDILSLQEKATVGQTEISNVIDSPEWQQLEGVVLEVLDEYPEGKRALQTRLIEAARGDNGSEDVLSEGAD